MIRLSVLILIMVSKSANSVESANLEYEVKKIVPSYKLEDGLYEVVKKEQGTVLYVFKQGLNVILQEGSHLTIEQNCKSGNNDD